ncbi:hypothetical protein A167_01984 [Alcanivorax sp. S71-1-4]|uniref:hypothetical protein n=1 Tax=Alcanivorax sp. S71-1-4 TaxID=1177159 RepID=UPI001356E0D0|nr:hypothetical protein [Alcanivorax sp. S71-1-4]KAF0809223.1 hypothetical protein A167_01984 [Alcanivorax sp. S71-1-4]
MTITLLLRLFCSAFLLSSLLPPAAQAHLLQLSGRDLGPLVGQPTAQFSVFSASQGQLRPVPHQWLPWSEDGLPAFRSDRSTRWAGQPGRINAGDRLFLDAQDAGEALDAAALSHSTENVVGELRVRHDDGDAYFYVVRNAYQQATQRYVRFDRERMQIKSTHYQLNMAPDNLLVWNDFFFRGYESPGGRPQSILDTLKIRLSAGVLGDRSRITLDNSNLSPRIEEVIEGPLVTAVYATTSVRFARVPVLNIDNYFLIMPQQTDIHSRFTLPGIANTVLNSPAVSMSLDGNQLLGARLRTSWTGELEARVDGTVSDTEQRMLDTPMSGRNWLWFSTGRQFDLLAELDFRDGFDTPVKLVYEDDRTLANPPERFPGQGPNVGFALQDIPFGQEFYFVARLLFSGDSQGLPAEDYARRALSGNSASYRVLGAP